LFTDGFYFSRFLDNKKKCYFTIDYFGTSEEVRKYQWAILDSANQVS
jgi:hypothetical protein